QTWEREKGGGKRWRLRSTLQSEWSATGKGIRERTGVAASAGAGPPVRGGPARIESNHLTARSESGSDSASTAGRTYWREPSTFRGAGAEEGVAGFFGCSVSGRGVSVPGMKVRR